jgi:hypothetical protein
VADDRGSALVPEGLREAVSSALGADQRRFWARRSSGGLAVSGGGFSTTFTLAGPVVRVQGDAVGLQLVGTNLGARVAQRPRMSSPVSARNQVSYRRGAVTEWYRNGPLGLEQGFTLRGPAAHKPGWMRFAVRVEGRLVARRVGAQIDFADPRGGGVVLAYGSLRAVDAAGRPLPTRLVLRGTMVSLLVNGARARYPVTVDPFIQQGGKLTVSGESGYVGLGASVALSANGNTALVGAPYEDNEFGAAWVFTRSGSVWTQQGGKLTPNDAGDSENGVVEFGTSVALSADGNTAMIGGPAYQHSTGAAWIFTRASSTWTQQGPKLSGVDLLGTAEFGRSVALSADGNTALAVAGDDRYTKSSAWVFTRSGSAWTQPGRVITISGQKTDGSYGAVATLSGDGNTVLITGGRDDQGKGGVWPFYRSASGWTQGPELTTGATDGYSDSFGSSLALSPDGDTALIGEPCNGRGRVWVFTRSGSAWSNRAQLTESSVSTTCYFGRSVALSSDGSTALAGGWGGGTGETGSAYAFAHVGGDSWKAVDAPLTPDDEVGQGDFGAGVALSATGGTAVVGGPADNSGQGAGWAFTRTGLPWCADPDQARRGSPRASGPGRAGSFTPRGSMLTGAVESGPAGFGASVAMSADGLTALVGGACDNTGLGAAWVYTRSGTTWVQQGAKLTPDDAAGSASGVGFGTAVALSADGNTAVVSGSVDNGKQGAVWVFTRSGSTWSQQGSKLTPNDETAQGEFGGAVAISGDGATILVGGADDGNGVGAGWVFTRSGSSWSQMAPKLVVNGSNMLGASVALSGDGNTALLSTSDGNGGVWVFTHSGSNWTQGPELTSISHGGGPGNFGQDVALSLDGNTALVGEPCYGRGAAWIFTRSGSAWIRQRELVVGDTQDCYFGAPVALSGDGDTAFVGDSDGSIWVFAHHNAGPVWTPENSQMASPGTPGTDGFGGAIAVSGGGSIALVGASQYNRDQGAAWVFSRTGAPCVYPTQVESSSGLLGYWRLGDSSGPTAVDETGQHNGTYRSGTTLDVSGAILGDANTAVSFDGSTGKVTIPSLGPAAGFTIQGWTYLDPSAANNANGDNALYASTNGIRIIIRPAGFFVDDLTTGQSLGAMNHPTDTNIGRWVYWVLVRTRSTLELYRNGDAMLSSVLAKAGPTRLNGSIGAQGTNYPLHGRVDEVAISNTSLSVPTIQQTYQCSGWG